MNRSHVASIILATVLASCSSSTTDPTPPVTSPQGPAAKRQYNASKGGVQITAIYYDQTKNGDSTGTMDEWVVIESDHPRRIAGWKLDANDPSQQYSLPDSIQSKLTVYTREGPSVPVGETLALHLSSWIWNNAEPDTARIFDANKTLMDSLSYVGK